MPTLAAQITIGDYAKWRPVFDKNKPLRDKAGLRNVRVDVAKAREALGSPEIRSAMQEAGVVGPPKIHVIA